MSQVDVTMLSFLALAFAMGLRHGFDADHIALIDGLTRYNSKDRPRLARRCGLLFTAGHMAVVLGLVMLVTYVLKAWETPAWLELSGTIVSIGFLLAIGVINISSAVLTEPGAQVTPLGLKSRFVGRVADGWGVFSIGMLFALSFDTVSQAGLMAIVGSRYGAVAPLLAGLAFGAGMFITAGLTSVWVARMSSRVDARAASASRIITLAIGIISLGIGAVIACALFAAPVAGWLETNGLWLSLGMTGGLAALFVGCLWLLRSSDKADGIV